MNERAVHVFVTGLVQGVGFRYFTIRKAQACGVKGYVRNCPDGRVEVWAEGPEERLQVLLKDLAKGPYSARVDKLDVQRPEQLKGFRHFDVKF